MTAENITIGLSLVLGGALIIAAGLPLLGGKIKPNATYGVRMAKSFESDENWFKMNRYGAKQMMIWAGVMMAFGVAAFLLPFRGNTLLLIIFAILPILLVLIPAFQIYRYSKTL